MSHGLLSATFNLFGFLTLGALAALDASRPPSVCALVRGSQILTGARYSAQLSSLLLASLSCYVGPPPPAQMSSLTMRGLSRVILFMGTRRRKASSCHQLV